MIRVTCPGCCASLDVPESQAGHVENCPDCGRDIVIAVPPGDQNVHPMDYPSADLPWPNRPLSAREKIVWAIACMGIGWGSAVGIFAACIDWDYPLAGWLAGAALLLFSLHFEILICTILICYFITRPHKE